MKQEKRAPVDEGGQLCIRMDKAGINLMLGSELANWVKLL